MSFGFMFIIVPIGLGLFLLEFYFLHKRGMPITLEQTALNMSLGFFDRLIGLYLTERALFLVHETVSIDWVKQLPENGWTFVLTFFAVDLVWYIFHRAGHRVSLMWGIHLVHHQSEEYNLSVNFALSPLGFGIRSVMYSGLVLVGFPVEYVIMSSYLNAFYQYYLHTEFIDRIPVLEHFLVMPAHHKVHHASNEQYLDKNYGGVFIIWDKLFGSYASKQERPMYGLTTALPQRDFVNIQLFFFKKLALNFKRYGILKGLELLWRGPEFQDADIPKVFEVHTRVRWWKVVLGGAIYVLSYKVMIEASAVWEILAVGVVNLLSIFLVNGIRTGTKEYRFGLAKKKEEFDSPSVSHHE
ncbi:MAG: Uncharacterised protein [Cryomorphaceae bacterium]|nr:MAG: Uncharacterised protein [Cryomorphaceae bacterium]